MSGRLFQLTRLFYSSSMSPSKKVAILGAAGGIGQPLSLLLKAFSKANERPMLSHLALYDIANMGMSVDLGHISTAVKVTGHSGPEQLADALKDASVVLIPAGVPRKPGMTRDDLFTINASIVRDLSAACARHCPKAHLLVISNPVNATVPIAYETLRRHGVAKPSVFGVTTLDHVRAQAFIGEALGVDPESVSVKVVGGHSGATIIPIVSRLLPESELDTLIQRIQYGGDEVVKAKAGGGSATLSMAYAAYRFFADFVRGGKVVAYVRIPDDKQRGYPAEYFATEVVADEVEGLREVLPMPELGPREKQLLDVAVQELQRDISKGKQFAAAGQ